MASSGEVNKKSKILVIYIYMRNDMSTIFLQQILSGKLLLVVIVGTKKIILALV